MHGECAQPVLRGRDARDRAPGRGESAPGRVGCSAHQDLCFGLSKPKLETALFCEGRFWGHVSHPVRPRTCVSRLLSRSNTGSVRRSTTARGPNAQRGRLGAFPQRPTSRADFGAAEASHGELPALCRGVPAGSTRRPAGARSSPLARASLTLASRRARRCSSSTPSGTRPTTSGRVSSQCLKCSQNDGPKTIT